MISYGGSNYNISVLVRKEDKVKALLALLQDYRVRRCYYGHIHGRGCPLAFNGWIGCTEFRLVSADRLNFIPELVLP